MNIYTEFNLKEVMESKGMTTKELAEMTGISKRTLDEYRAARKNPSLCNGLKIADALRIDPRELYKKSTF